MKLITISSFAACTGLILFAGIAHAQQTQKTTTTTQIAAEAKQREGRTGTSNESSVKQMGQIEGKCSAGYILAKDGNCYTHRQLCEKNKVKCD